jgi:hypothetical protein
VTHRAALRTLGAFVVSLVALVPLAVPALADKSKPMTSSAAWYWENQETQTVPNPEGGDAATVDTLENPFCPTVPGGLGSVPGGVCREGRLPVEVVGGDYETPDKISALAWDFSTVLPGSTVSKFIVTLEEASDPQSKPVNVDGKEVKACFVNEFFGDGEAREYKKAPRYKCAKKGDPVGERKKVAPKQPGGDPTFEWVFDLTKFAQIWAKGKSPAAAVMLFPEEPKKPGAPDNADWRVVFTGAHDKGVKTLLVSEPPKVEVDDPTTPNDNTNDDPGNDTSDNTDSTPTVPPATGTDGTDYSSTSSTSSSGDFGTGTVDTSGTGVTDSGTVTDTPTPQAPVQAAPGSEAAADTTVPVESFPGYVWLAILGGLIGFSLVRRTVIESTTGARPDGVLAQIREMNARRRGVAPAAIESTPGTFGKFIGTVRSGASSAFSKLPKFGRKG